MGAQVAFCQSKIAQAVLNKNNVAQVAMIPYAGTLILVTGKMNYQPGCPNKKVPSTYCSITVLCMLY
jgi:hypothetical protein